MIEIQPVKRIKTRQTKHASAKRVRESKPDGRGDDNVEITSSSDSGASDDDFLNIEVDEKKLQRVRYLMFAFE
jgi:anti-sigma28 factor (negative regulator of flagellin synthesis)